jgi:hypothetical protein
LRDQLMEPALKQSREGKLRGVSFEAMSVDVLDTLTGDTREAARHVDAPLSFVWAERGLQGEPVGYYALDAVHAFAAERPLRIAEGHDLDHVSVMLSDRGTQLVAGELLWALSTG